MSSSDAAQWIGAAVTALAAAIAVCKWVEWRKRKQLIQLTTPCQHPHAVLNLDPH